MGLKQIPADAALSRVCISRNLFLIFVLSSCLFFCECSHNRPWAENFNHSVISRSSVARKTGILGRSLPIAATDSRNLLE